MAARVGLWASSRGLMLAGVLACMSMSIEAQGIGPELAARLTESQQRAYVFYLRARGSFDLELQAYWIAVDAKRDERKKKRTAGQPFAAGDYIPDQPPKYAGPALAPDIAKIVTEVKPAEPETPKPVVADFLAAARAEYGFVPAPTTEREFKRRYATEALALGLSKAQVVRVYALETGGRGTTDMQAGIDPETKQGQADLLRARLCAAAHREFDQRAGQVRRWLRDAPRGDGQRRPAFAGARVAQLRAKVLSLRTMQRAARSVSERVGGARQVRQHAEGARHSCPQSRRRHRPVAAGDQA